jgi:aspartyl-tRNA(Asn)/glutamyl-tRNA(Gln) amidotransferase subunit C
MQEVDEAKVRHIARLARLKITDEEAVSLGGEINAILKWIEQLQAVDTEGVEPMTRVVSMSMKQRPDEVSDGGIAEEIVKNAPMSEDHFFVVPKVVD